MWAVKFNFSKNETAMGKLLCEMRLQGIVVVIFMILDWRFVLMNTITMILCRRVL